jgi:multidrug efflux pump subunit AcrB
MNLYREAVKRPITILMVVIAVLIIGGVSLSRLSVDLYPDIELPIVATIVSYEGVGPEEMEQLITRPIEESVSGLPGIKQVTSTSSRGSTMVIAEFNYGTDMDYSEMKVREKVDTVKSFLPDGASSPMVIRFNLEMMPVMMMGVTGDREAYEIKSEFDSLEDLENVLIPLKTGGTIQLKYVADIEDAFAKMTMYSFLNGNNSIGLNIYKQSDANTVGVSKKVNAELEKIKGTLPSGVEVLTAYDSAEFINLSIGNVINNGFFGALFAVIVFYLSFLPS